MNLRNLALWILDRLVEFSTLGAIRVPQEWRA